MARIAASYRAWVDLFEKLKEGTAGGSDCATGEPTTVNGVHLCAVGYDELGRAEHVRTKHCRLGESLCLTPTGANWRGRIKTQVYDEGRRQVRKALKALPEWWQPASTAWVARARRNSEGPFISVH
jgi:hypothetical protein